MVGVGGVLVGVKELDKLEELELETVEVLDEEREAVEENGGASAWKWPFTCPSFAICCPAKGV